MNSRNPEAQGINIEGLPKEKVLIALLKNVYKKSRASLHASLYWRDLSFEGVVRHSAPSTVINGVDSEYEARQILYDNNNMYIDDVGPVKLCINFANNLIDTRVYDQTHETSTTPEIKTAKDCIEQVRYDHEQEQIKEAKETAKREARQEAENKVINTARELIKKLLANDNCQLSAIYGHLVEIDFNSKPSFETLQELEKILTAVGLSVKVRTESTQLNGILVIPAVIKMLDPLEMIIEKLSAHFSQRLESGGALLL